MSRLKEKGGLLSTVLADDVYYRNRWKLWLLEAKSVLAMPHGTYSTRGANPFLKFHVWFLMCPYNFKKYFQSSTDWKKWHSSSSSSIGLGKNKCDLKKHFSPIVSSSLNMPNQNLSITKSNGSQRVRRLLCSPSISFLSFPFRARTWGYSIW